MRVWLILFLIKISVISTVISVNNLVEEFTWTRINYNWHGGGRTRRGLEARYGGSYGRPHGHGFRPYGHTHWSHNHGNCKDQRKNYIYENNVPIGVAVWKDKMFITVPRRQTGIPSTLNYVNLNLRIKHNVPLNPYPSWEMNSLPENNTASTFDSTFLRSSDNEKLISVYRIAVDRCDRLWLVDTGKLEVPNATVQIQPPRLIIMDLRTDTILRQYIFPESDLRPTSLFTHISVETDTNDCSEAHAYISDILGYGMVVFSLKENKSWRITHDFFNSDPIKAELNIGGFKFKWNDGLFSTALSSKKNNGERDLYFNAMAGSHLYKVQTDVLKNESSAIMANHGPEFIDLGDRGENSQTSVSALHQPSGILFLSLVNQNALACWNVNTPLSDISIVHKDDEKLIYPCDLKVHNDKIYLFTNNMPIFVYGKLDYDKINFKIWVQNIKEAVSGTKCSSEN